MRTPDVQRPMVIGLIRLAIHENRFIFSFDGGRRKIFGKSCGRFKMGPLSIKSDDMEAGWPGVGFDS
jgi:hypothetical protein